MPTTAQMSRWILFIVIVVVMLTPRLAQAQLTNASQPPPTPMIQGTNDPSPDDSDLSLIVLLGIGFLIEVVLVGGAMMVYLRRKRSR